MDTSAKIERYKGIAEYISVRTGISVSENSARKWSARSWDPLPVVRFSGRIVADAAELDAWIERQHGVGRRRRDETPAPALRVVRAAAGGHR